MRCTTMGWGQMFMHGPYANEIMFLDVVIANHSLCSEKIRDYHAEGNLCTKPEADGNICAGDMGGPLLCEDHLVGIIGGAQQCIRVDAIKFVNYTYFEGWVDRTVYQLTGAAAFHNLAIYLLISQVM
ncbi:chymotrypsin-1-like [Scaptodrosophila lebanonensis]|nr:chymotrypsin-1-like [Scaptodrosophila lebanonensis]